MIPRLPQSRFSLAVRGPRAERFARRMMRVRDDGHRRYGLCWEARETQKKAVDAQKYLDNPLEWPINKNEKR